MTFQKYCAMGAAACCVLVTGCIHRHREWPPRNIHKTISFSAHERESIATLISSSLFGFPEIRVACLSIENIEDSPYSYEPDSELLREIKSTQKVVASRNCPPIYDLQTKPPGYMNPWGVFVGDIQFLGKNRTDATIELRERNSIYRSHCHALRIGRHNWKVFCPYGEHIILARVLPYERPGVVLPYSSNG